MHGSERTQFNKDAYTFFSCILSVGAGPGFADDLDGGGICHLSGIASFVVWSSCYMQTKGPTHTDFAIGPIKHGSSSFYAWPPHLSGVVLVKLVLGKSVIKDGDGQVT